MTLAATLRPGRRRGGLGPAVNSLALLTSDDAVRGSVVTI